MPDEQNVLLLEEHQDKSCFEKPSLPCSLVWLLVCMLAIALGVGIAIVIMQSTDHPPLVLTTCGQVEGTYDVEPDVHVYRGIPYAAPPTGDGRWRRPVPLTNHTGTSGGTCWQGTLKATTSREPCPRLGDKEQVVGSEDCLVLDVFTPAGVHNTGLMPVVVWMDAGPVNGAAISGPGDTVASRTKAVYVKVQYRTGIMGFLVANELGKNQTGNYGIWDQIEALRWIRDNIARFGGDSKKVTLMSQGSTSTSGLVLMTSPYAKGLFHRAWLLSTSPIANTTLEKAKDKNTVVIDNTGCRDAACLRKLPLIDLLKADRNPPFVLKFPKKNQFQEPMAVIDGDLLPDEPLKAWQTKTGNYPDVPIFMGTLAHEGTSLNKKLNNASQDDLLKYLMDFLNTFSPSFSPDRVLSVYNVSRQGDQASKLATMVSDIRVGCGVNALSRAAAYALSSPVYRYVVTNQPSTRAVSSDGETFSTYGWDSYSFFGWEGRVLDQHAKKSDFSFVQIIQTLGQNFIRLGDPKYTRWTKFPGTTGLIGVNVTLSSVEYHKEECEFWDKAGLLDYGWMN